MDRSHFKTDYLRVRLLLICLLAIKVFFYIEFIVIMGGEKFWFSGFPLFLGFAEIEWYEYSRVSRVLWGIAVTTRDEWCLPYLLESICSGVFRDR